MSRTSRFLLVLFTLVMVIALVGWAQAAAQGEKAGKKAGAAKGNAKEGESIFNSKCAICHGKDASGNTPMGKNLKLRDLRSEDVQKQTDDQLFELIAKGKGKMQSYEKSLGPSRSTTRLLTSAL